MDLVGKRIINGAGVFGVVIEQIGEFYKQGSYLRVQYEGQPSPVKLPIGKENNVIQKGFANFEDGNVQNELLRIINEADNLSKNNLSELAKKAQAENALRIQRLKEQEAKSKKPDNKSKITTDNKNKVFVKKQRKPGERLCFLVYQNKTFSKDTANIFIWAPKTNHFFHTELLNVEPGDVIFHMANRKVMSISIAKTKAYDFDNPYPKSSDKNWQKDGRRIDLFPVESCPLDSPLNIDRYNEDIIRIRAGKKYYPFDRYGGGNQGFLYELPLELAHIFGSAIKEATPDFDISEKVKFIYE